MKQGIFKIESNEALTLDVYKMVLRGDTSACTAPGQFVNIEIPELFLRRPISVCDKQEDMLTLIYKAVGRGTDKMSRLKAGETLDLLTGLGNGYDLEKCGNAPLLIGGGVGVPPMYLLAKKLLATGKRPSVILGFNTKSEIFYEAEFRALGIPVFVTTVDGSSGIRGFVTDAMREAGDYSDTCACGPEPMLKAVFAVDKEPGQFSFEERMGCGFGACMGCSYQTKNGIIRICKDGPVLSKEELLW